MKIRFSTTVETPRLVGFAAICASALLLVGCATSAQETPTATSSATTTTTTVPSSPASTSASSASTQDTTGGLWIELASGSDLEQAGGGVRDDGSRWQEFTGKDGVLAVSIDRVSEQAAQTPAEMKKQITANIADVDASTWSLESNAELSAAYSYPTSVFEFTSGANEDAIAHLGIYVQTDSGGFVVDTALTSVATDADRREADQILKNLTFVDA